VARRLREFPELAHIPLILFTSSQIDHLDEDLRQAGFTYLLKKPLRSQELESTLAKLLPNDGLFDNSAKDQPFPGARILLVEDNRINMEYAHELLQAIGCLVTPAANGKEALELAQQNLFDAILMDCEMPVMDGFQAAAALTELKQQHKLHDIPIIALTARDIAEDRDRCTLSGMCDYIMKPLRRDSLIETLNRWIFDGALHNDADERLAEKSVLLVEDNMINREFALGILEEFGCTVMAVENGKKAVDVFSSHAKFDIVLMDCQMPEMDGYEATGEILRLCRERSITAPPIIALTAHAMKGDREKCLAAGMNDYLAKPYVKNELRDIMLKWIKADA
jgi:CheY-like chemotaxis protein